MILNKVLFLQGFGFFEVLKTNLVPMSFADCELQALPMIDSSLQDERSHIHQLIRDRVT